MHSRYGTDPVDANSGAPLPPQPLRIEVTPLGRLHQPLCALLRQIVPALQSPETVPLSFRKKLAQDVLAFLEAEGDELCLEPGD